MTHTQTATRNTITELPNIALYGALPKAADVELSDEQLGQVNGGIIALLGTVIICSAAAGFMAGASDFFEDVGDWISSLF